MRRASVIICFLLLATGLLASSPRLTFERVVSPPHDLGTVDEIVVVRAAGNPQALDTFVDTFLEQVGQSGLLRASDGRRRPPPPATHLAFEPVDCTVVERTGEGSVRDAHGERVKRTHHWADAVCTATVAVLSRDRRLTMSFTVRGEGTSPRVAEITQDERAIAVRQAVRFSAIAAAEQVTPRRVREAIELDEEAPAFESGMAFVRTGRLDEARKAWERALIGNAGSAALHFDLAAVCEALGDRDAAAKHYAAARELAPGNDRYDYGLRQFLQRGTAQRR